MILGQITDLHIKALGHLAYRVVDTTGALQRCVQAILALPERPDVMVITGDMVDSGRAEDYALLRDLLAPLTMPIYMIPGNHDDREVLRAAFPEQTYLRGTNKLIEYVIEDHPLRIIGLDTVIRGAAGGQLSDASISWLDRTLGQAPDRPTVILMHHPPFRTGIGHMDDVGLETSWRLREVLERQPQVERILCGHLHRAIHMRFGRTIASTCPSPAHQVVLDLRESAPSHFVMEPGAFQLHVLRDGNLVSHTAYTGEFDGPYSFVDDDPGE